MKKVELITLPETGTNCFALTLVFQDGWLTNSSKQSVYRAMANVITPAKLNPANN